MIKNIIFIEPYEPRSNYFSLFKVPRLGSVILGSILKNYGYTVKIYIEYIKSFKLQTIVQSADLVCFSCISSNVQRGYDYADQIKKIKNIPIVFGGIHPSALYNEAIQHADYVICGEGEKTLPQLVDAINNNSDLSKIPGLVYKQNQELRISSVAREFVDLQQNIIPDYSLIAGQEKINRVSTYTSRGCPFNCNYCTVTPMFGKKYRTRSVQEVISELKSYKKIKSLTFVDDNIGANKKYLKELLREMIKNKITPRWHAQARVDIAHDLELVQLLRQANCGSLAIGLESINDEVLDKLDKGQKVADIEHCLQVLDKHNINVLGMLMFGTDHDKKDVFVKTAEFVKSNSLESCLFFIFTPPPGSEIFNKYELEGRILTKDWKYYDAQHVVFRPKNIRPQELLEGVIYIMKEFTSWREIFKMIFKPHKLFMRLIMKYVYEVNIKYMCKTAVVKNDSV